jgi:hypothetical protein
VAVDLQIAVPQEAIRVSRVTTVPGLPVRTLRITGDDFRSADEVLMNEVKSPSFVVLNKGTLLAQVPDALKGGTVTSVSVLSRNLIITPKSFIKFRLGTVPGKTKGILRLMQVFLRLLLQTPGSDIFAPKLGGGALSHLGQSISTEEGSDVISSFIISVDNTKSQLIQIQSRNQLIPPDERLLNATVLSAGFNKNETAIITSIQLDSQAGASAVARFEL